MSARRSTEMARIRASILRAAGEEAERKAHDGCWPLWFIGIAQQRAGFGYSGGVYEAFEKVFSPIPTDADGVLAIHFAAAMAETGDL